MCEYLNHQHNNTVSQQKVEAIASHINQDTICQRTLRALLLELKRRKTRLPTTQALYFSNAKIQTTTASLSPTFLNFRQLSYIYRYLPQLSSTEYKMMNMVMLECVNAGMCEYGSKKNTNKLTHYHSVTL